MSFVHQTQTALFSADWCVGQHRLDLHGLLKPDEPAPTFSSALDLNGQHNKSVSVEQAAVLTFQSGGGQIPTGSDHPPKQSIMMCEEQRDAIFLSGR